MSAQRIGKGNFAQSILSLAFFLLLFCLPLIRLQADYPVIQNLDTRDISFRQFISDVENNRRRLSGVRRPPAELAEYLTIYQYFPKSGEDIFFLSARCNIPYSALASLNKLNNPHFLQEGKPILLPSSPGLFLPETVNSELEKLTTAFRSQNMSADSIKIIINTNRTETFHFFPGADFTPTERTFFLNSGFRFPLKDFRLTSSFGLRANPITGNLIVHEGMDLAAPEGTEVFAVGDGIVTDMGFDPIYGNYVVISHGGSLASLYGHLQKIETVLRSGVKSGTLIGRVGSTGQSTGPHLHFELRQDGRAIDPAGRLRRRP